MTFAVNHDFPGLENKIQWLSMTFQDLWGERFSEDDSSQSPGLVLESKLSFLKRPVFGRLPEPNRAWLLVVNFSLQTSQLSVH